MRCRNGILFFLSRVLELVMSLAESSSSSMVLSVLATSVEERMEESPELLELRWRLGRMKGRPWKRLMKRDQRRRRADEGLE